MHGCVVHDSGCSTILLGQYVATLAGYQLRNSQNLSQPNLVADLLMELHKSLHKEFHALPPSSVPCMTTMVSSYGDTSQKGIIMGVYRSLGALAR